MTQITTDQQNQENYSLPARQRQINDFEESVEEDLNRVSQIGVEGSEEEEQFTNVDSVSSERPERPSEQVSGESYNLQEEPEDSPDLEEMDYDASALVWPSFGYRNLKDEGVSNTDSSIESKKETIPSFTILTEDAAAKSKPIKHSYQSIMGNRRHAPNSAESPSRVAVYSFIAVVAIAGGAVGYFIGDFLAAAIFAISFGIVGEQLSALIFSKAETHEWQINN